MSTWGRSKSEIRTDEPGPVRLEKVGRKPGGRPAFAIGLVLVLVVGLLVLKPWASWPAQPVDTLPTFVAAATATPASTRTSTPAPTIDPMVQAASRRQCKSPADWRMVTAESTAARETRTMYAAYPSLSSGPTDASLALSHLYAGSLKAIGVCVPRSEDAVVTAELARVVLWQITDAGAVREIHNPIVIDRPLFLAGEVYWAPPIGEPSTWPVGRYIFEIRPNDGGPSRWMGVQFVHVAQSGAASVALP